MSYLVAAPELMASAATDLATIGSNVTASAAAASTVWVPPAAADEVSASVANLFSQHAAEYQAFARHAAAFHEQFLQTLSAGAASYGSTAAVSAASLLSPAADGALPIDQASGHFAVALRESANYYFRILFDPLFHAFPAPQALVPFLEHG